PYITDSLLRQMKIRDALHKRALQSQNPVDFLTFKRFRNRLQQEIRNRKKQYMFQKFAPHLDSKSVWRSLSQVANFKQQSGEPSSIKAETGILSNKEMCDYFNNYFVNITANLGIDRNTPDVCYDSPTERSKCSFTHVTETDVLRYISRMKNSNAAGVDNLQVISIKISKYQIAKVITHLINLSFNTGSFPEKLKIAKTIVLYKKGDKMLAENYRPISILPIISKVFERAIYDQLYHHLSPLITTSQYGFIPNSSTELALLELKERILNGFDKNSVKTLAIIIDFSKAFDCCNHQVILHKLHNYGIKCAALQLIKSYLNDRVQCVKINGVESSRLGLLNGVPQGSILGPLLFLVYVNDLAACLKNPNSDLIQF